MVPLTDDVRQDEDEEERPAKRGRWGDLTVRTRGDEEADGDGLPPFDPIKAHRYFCPVIVDDGEKGWRLCVWNLEKEKETK